MRMRNFWRSETGALNYWEILTEQPTFLEDEEVAGGYAKILPHRTRR